MSISLLEWYFEAIFPLQSTELGIIGTMAKVGAACLLAGVVLGLIQRHRPLLLFLIPAATAHLYVAGAGWFERSMPYPPGDRLAVVPFLLLQLALCLYLVFRTARVAGVFLAIFALTYSWFAGFIGGMALTGDWL